MKAHHLFLYLALLILSNPLRAESNPSERLLVHAAKGNIDSCWHYLQNGADINYKNTYEETPLLFAILNQKHETVQFLLENGALTTSQRRDKLTPLMFACYLGEYESAYILARYTNYLDALDFNHATALHYAIYSGNIDIIEMLLHYDADATLPTKSLNTPLHLAMYFTDTLIADMLLAKGARMEAMNHQKLTPIMIAAQQNNTEVFKYLHRKGANMQTMLSDSIGLLSIAVINHNMELIKYLVPLDTTIYPKSAHYNPANLARQSLAFNDRAVFRNFPNKPSLKPKFLRHSVQVDFMFNENDHALGAYYTITDINNRFCFGVGYSKRLKLKRVVWQDGSMEGKVLFETKPSINLIAYKLIPGYINTMQDREFGVYLGVRTQFQIEREVKTKKTFILPLLGLYYHLGPLNFNVGYTYASYNYAWISPHYLQLGITSHLFYYHRQYYDPYLPSWF